MDDRLTCLATVGGPPDDPVLQPSLDADGRFLLESGEAVQTQLQAKTQVCAFLGGGWTPLLLTRSTANVFFTTHRLLVSWPRWKSEASVGSFFDRRVASTFLERDMGKMMLAGHVRHQWVKNVQLAATSGFRGLAAQIRVIVEHEDGVVSAVVIDRVQHAEAEEACIAFAASVAHERSREGASAEDRETLAAISERMIEPMPAGSWRGFTIPNAVAVGQVHTD